MGFGTKGCMYNCGDVCTKECIEPSIEDEMSNVKIRFPNESTYTEITNFDWLEFKKEKEFEGCMFGWYDGIYISIYEEDNRV